MTSSVSADLNGPRPADPAQLEEIIALVHRSGLPVEGVATMVDDGALLVATGDGGDVVGVVGLERHGDHVLLRSLAVDEGRRGSGAGRTLVHAAIDAAGTSNVWLLTETAEELFADCGFRVVPREEVAGPVTESFEWRHACPDSATAMTLA